MSQAAQAAALFFFLADSFRRLIYRRRRIRFWTLLDCLLITVFTFAARSDLVCDTMMTGRCRFNIYLLLVSAALAGGCSSTTTDPKKAEKQKEKAEKKLAAAMALYPEVQPQSMDFSKRVSIVRDHPFSVNIDSAPILTEANIAEARMLDATAGVVLQIQFDHEGTWLLESFTSANPGKRLAILCQFGDKMKESRWLAAPMIPKRISNGVLTFTPDASREETEKIVAGLNNVAKKVQGDLKF
jgi:hypothetical protein